MTYLSTYPNPSQDMNPGQDGDVLAGPFIGFVIGTV